MAQSRFSYEGAVSLHENKPSHRSGSSPSMTGRPEATAQSNRLRLSGPTAPHSSVLRPLPRTLRTPPWESRRIEGAGIPLAWMKHPSGIYVLELQLSRKIHLKAGALQRRILLPGRYFYVGRAMRGLAARLNRHRVRVKSSPRWHIDYLRSRTRFVAVHVHLTNDSSLECETAGGLLADSGRIPIPRFGASDCKCPAHLIYFPR